MLKRSLNLFKKSIWKAKLTPEKLLFRDMSHKLAGNLKISLPGWKVLVGPQDAADIESYVKSLGNN